jgi:hypothetical protein
MAFHIGQRVVRIEGYSWRRSSRHAIPEPGVVYTVRAIVDRRSHRCDVDGVLLVEIVSPVQRYRRADGRWRRCEVAIRTDCLGPVRTTSIEVFTNMLESMPQKATKHEMPLSRLAELGTANDILALWRKRWGRSRGTGRVTRISSSWPRAHEDVRDIVARLRQLEEDLSRRIEESRQYEPALRRAGSAFRGGAMRRLQAEEQRQ